MNRKDILQALDEISNARIEKTAHPPRRKVKKIYWYTAVAAALAVVIFVNLFLPVPASAQTIAKAQYPVTEERLDISMELAGLDYYFSRTLNQFLRESQGNDNVAFSPMNLYMALAMLAETTDGETRAEILSLLGATDMDSLRQQANTLWRKSYQTEKSKCTLANSVWLQEGIPYNQNTMNTLAENYFASVYGNDFSASNAAEPIVQWINQETAGLLEEQTAALKFTPRTVMALVSTVYLRADWASPFREELNTQGVFNGTKGQADCTFMNRIMWNNYFWGDDYSAVRLDLNGYNQMWLILPDEGKTIEDLLQSGNYTDLFLSGKANAQRAEINLSMPKFDVTCKQDMIEGLQALGVKQVFRLGQADFTPAFPDQTIDIAVDKVEQATRVRVDEEGVTAASYVVIGMDAGAMPPKEKVDFVLDRPFLFVITNAGMPLFAGVVNNP